MNENYSAQTDSSGKDSIRTNPRQRCSVPVNYVNRDQIFIDYIRDISVDGIFIETSHSFKIGDKISVVIPFSKGNRKVKLKGKIVRSTQDGVGVKFIKQN